MGSTNILVLITGNTPRLVGTGNGVEFSSNRFEFNHAVRNHAVINHAVINHAVRNHAVRNLV